MDRKTAIESIYSVCREKVDVNKKEQAKATVLAKAILKSQKQTLILTGVLRLCNTIVQAFPSLLIAHL